MRYCRMVMAWISHWSIWMRIDLLSNAILCKHIKLPNVLVTDSLQLCRFGSQCELYFRRRKCLQTWLFSQLQFAQSRSLVENYYPSHVIMTRHYLMTKYITVTTTKRTRALTKRTLFFGDTILQLKVWLASTLFRWILLSIFNNVTWKDLGLQINAVTACCFVWRISEVDNISTIVWVLYINALSSMSTYYR